MKRIVAVTLLALASAAPAQNALRAAGPGPMAPVAPAPPLLSEPAIVERGPHHRVWQRAQVELLPNGRARTNVSSFVELGSGLHRWDPAAGQWRDARDVIEVLGDHAVARQAAHEIIFAPTADSPGVIDLLLPDGRRLRSHVIGLAFFDPKSGKSEMFASIREAAGELHPPNVVVYPNCFDGVAADLVYINQIGSFEQNVVLREAPKVPPDFDPATTLVEVWTEFLAPPEPVVTQRARHGMPHDGLDFGSMETGSGRAFALGDRNGRGGATVVQRWLVADQRTFLVEQVRHAEVKAHLDQLPPARGQARVAPRRQTPAEQQASLRPFPAGPAARAARPRDPATKFRTAALDAPSPLEPAGPARAALPRRPDPTALAQARENPADRTTPTAGAKPARGLVLDYTLVTTATCTFQGDTTYVASNAVTLSGTTTFEGGCVIKFAKTNAATLNLSGTSVWHTAAYRPVILTAVDDHTVGEKIGTGTLSGYYGGTMLNLQAPPGNVLQHLRLSHAATALKSGDAGFTVRHAQFVHCQTAVDYQRASGSYSLENVLLHDIGTLQYGGAYLAGTNLTAHQCTNFGAGASPASSAQLLNSILDVADWGTASPSLTSCYELDGDPGVFQTVGAAAHYLANNSPQRNAGAALTGTLATDLAQMTTYPPLVLTNAITNDTTLYPQAQRDVDTPDRGYHYPPLDFVMSGVVLTNATLTLAPGVAVGAAGGYGVAVVDGARLISAGTPTALNRLVRYDTVQEMINTNWAGCSDTVHFYHYGAGAVPSVRARFTEFSVLGGGSPHLAAGGYNGSGTFALTDCQFAAGSLTSYRAHVHLTNCLLHRVTVLANDDAGDFDLTLRNTALRGGNLTLNHYNAGAWTLYDNLFDATALAQDGDVTSDFNAYTANLTVLTPAPLTTNYLLSATNFTFETGPLGRFYQPTNSALLNAGSTWATNVGLYHFTTTTNQVKEGATVLDLGFHYVAVTNGVPFDIDGDGWSDYAEDANGNGAADSGELSWQSYQSLFGIGAAPGLQVFTPLKR